MMFSVWLLATLLLSLARSDTPPDEQKCYIEGEFGILTLGGLDCLSDNPILSNI